MSTDTTETPQAAPQPHRRRLKNIRIFRDPKLRLVFGCMTAGMLVSSISLFNMQMVVGHALQNAPAADPALRAFLDQIDEIVSRALGIGLVLSLCSAAIALLFGLMVSHRYNGPAVPLARHLRELRDGGYAKRVQLRPGDELTELAEAQNELAAELEKRFGAGPKA